MFQSIASSDIAHVIQLAVAPVFLLTGIGAILNVMVNRLSRVVDRARVLESKLEHADESGRPDIEERLAMLSRRARLVSHAIALCVLTAVLVCAVIFTLFLGAFLSFKSAVPAALLFIAALLTLLLALIWLLREVFLATASLKIGAPQ